MLPSLAAAALVYKSKTVKSKPAHEESQQQRLRQNNNSLVWTVLLMGTLLHAHPYSERSSALDRWVICNRHLSLKQPQGGTDDAESAPVSPDHVFQTIGSVFVSASDTVRSKLGGNEAEPKADDQADDDGTVAMPACLEAAWPTPTAPMWADIEMVAVRALVTLEWANQEACTAVATPGPTETWPALRQALILLIDALLRGHILDWDLDMSKVLKFGLLPVLREAADFNAAKVGRQCIRRLTQLFLKRLYTDKVALEVLSEAEGTGVEPAYQLVRNRHC